MRRLIAIAILATAGTFGCQQVFTMSDGVIAESHQVDSGPAASVDKTSHELRADVIVDDGIVSAPRGPISTVAAPDAPKRLICLAECIALALENGRTGEQFDRAGSERRTSVNGLTRLGPASAATDSVRVFAYDPAIVGTEIEEALSKFDALWRTSAVWNRTSQPDLSANFIPSIGVLNGQIENTQLRTEILKPLSTGGVAGLTFRTDYERANLPSFNNQVVNPAYQPAVGVTFEQPLLQGAGVLINQLRETHPGSIRNPFPTGGRVPGILLTRIAHDQTRLDFVRRVQDVLFAVEEAYWDLYSAYWDLYSRESGLRLAHDAWQKAKARFEARGGDPEEMQQTEEQFHFFRTQRLAALGRGTPGRPGVLEAERRLRYVIGLPAEDGARLLPTDAPVVSPLEPDWNGALAEAMVRRPEVEQVRQEIRATQLALLKARDGVLPDLRFLSRLEANGLGGTLGSSFRNLGQDPYPSWELGLQMQMPIGFREGHAQLTRARLQLAQRYAFLRDQEGKVLSSLQRSYRDLVQFREEARTRRSQRESVAKLLQARYDKFKAGKGTTEFLMQAQRSWADALRDEYSAICSYNIALADFERQKGTIMEYDNVAFKEGPIPGCVSSRASDHIRSAAAPRALVNNSSTGHGVSVYPDLVGYQQPPALHGLHIGEEP